MYVQELEPRAERSLEPIQAHRRKTKCEIGEEDAGDIEYNNFVNSLGGVEEFYNHRGVHEGRQFSHGPQDPSMNRFSTNSPIQWDQLIL
jgi:hypothetical protein